MKQKNDFLKTIFEIALIFVSAILVTLGVLAIVEFFEKNNIHVAGNREMWIGFIGAILGGVYTLLGVQITVRVQKRSDVERQRLENMPILQFETSTTWLEKYYDNKGQGIFTLYKNEFYTTGFPKDALANYPTIEISLASSNPAFNVRIDSCITTEHKSVPQKTKYYFPQEYRLVEKEKILNMFWIQDYDTYPCCKVLGVMRIAYSDIFGNPYYQDISFTYDEKIRNKEEMLTFDKVMPPVLANKSAPTLLNRIKTEFSYSFEEKKQS